MASDQPVRRVRITADGATNVEGTRAAGGSSTGGRRPPRRRLGWIILVGCLAAAAVVVALVTANHRSEAERASGAAPETVRLGYFANVTHASALVGVEQGIFQKALGSSTLKTAVFNAGPSAVEALNAGSIDAAFIGPSPAINSYTRSGGKSLVVVSGATSGGAQLIVNSSITTAADLKGKTLSTPQLGGTQDVALRTWLTSQGLRYDKSGPDAVAVNPTENAQTLTLFKDGRTDGAWVPEPWASRLVLEGKGHVLVDERSLWEGGQFPTTVLVVSQDFAAQHPDQVQELVSANGEAVRWLNSASLPDKEAAINRGLVSAGSKKLPAATLQRALSTISFTTDPQASAYQQLLDHAVAAGQSKAGSLDGLVDHTYLDRISR
jgi:NitT/TauT family transport system substrate-binding protein